MNVEHFHFHSRITVSGFSISICLYVFFFKISLEKVDQRIKKPLFLSVVSSGFSLIFFLFDRRDF